MIVSKHESDCAIIRLGLNKMLEVIFTKNSTKEDVVKLHAYTTLNAIPEGIIRKVFVTKDIVSRV